MPAYIQGGHSLSVQLSTTAGKGRLVSQTLEYASDGVHFTLLSDLDGDDGQYDWNVPSVDLSGVKLRLTVQDEYGKTTTTTSNAFGIDSTPPSIHLTAPNGGESVMGPTSFTVTWSASDAHLASAPITLQYSTDGGSTWVAIASGIANGGSYAWHPAALETANIRMRAIAVDLAGNSSSDDSDAVFTIDTQAPVLASATIQNTSPTTSNFMLSYGAITGSYSDYCILKNDTDVTSCSWTAGVLPSSFDPQSNGDWTLSFWLKDSNGNVSSRLDAGPVHYEIPVKNTSKNISGAPGSTVTISFSEANAADLHLKFRDTNTAEVVESASVAIDGSVTLPSKAGVYTTELENVANGSVSYGQATVTDPISSWTSTQTQSLGSYAPYRACWPDSNRAIGDYTGDGYPDLAFAEGQTTTGTSVAPGIYLYSYDPIAGQYSFDTRLVSTHSYIFGIRFVDIDGDGVLDLVYGRAAPSAYSADLCYMMNLGGIFGAPTCLTDSTATSSDVSAEAQIAVADIDRDGFPDVVLAGGRTSGGATTKDRIVYYHNTGSGFEISKVIEEASTLRFTDLRIADMDDDGRLDIVALTGDNLSGTKVYVFPQASDGTFDLSTVRKSACPNSGFMTVGYLNSDTKPDIIVTQQGEPGGHYLQSNASDDTLAVSSFNGPAEKHGSLSTVADLNGDGTPEIYFGSRLTISYAGKVGIYFRTASSLGSSMTLNASNTILGATSASGYTESAYDFADLNQDGKIDVLLVSPYSAPYFETIEGN